MNDLKSELPHRFADMLSDNEVWALLNDVLPMPEVYSRTGAIFRRGFN